MNKPTTAADAFFLAREIGERMLSRLDIVTLQPKTILSLTNDDGYSASLLQKRYPDAQLLFDAEQEPESTDLIVANLWLPWRQDLQLELFKWRAILRPEGLLMFSSLGPDTLRELDEPILPQRIDMHDVGDAMTHAGWIDPVLDVEYLTVTYKESQQLQKELQITHMVASDDTIRQFEKNEHGQYAVTYEIVYGHAWGPGLSSGYAADEFGVVRIPLSQLRGRK